MMVQPLTFLYTNYRGETSVRRVIPIKIMYEPHIYHPDAQWLMEAYDLDKKDIRTFALKDIADMCAGDGQFEWEGYHVKPV